MFNIYVIHTFRFNAFLNLRVKIRTPVFFKNYYVYGIVWAEIGKG